MAETKREKYEMLCKQVESLVAGETNVVGVLANVSAAMKTMFPEEFFWVGFYLVRPQGGRVQGAFGAVQWPSAVQRVQDVVRDDNAASQRSSVQGKQGAKVSPTGEDLEGGLLLGPFQGTVACYEIPYGKGVCGTAWKERRTLVVPDVEEFPGHIACSSLSRSEIVVPMFLSDEDEEDGRGDVWGVIDIDSTELGTFDEVDAEYLERIAEILDNGKIGNIIGKSGKELV